MAGRTKVTITNAKVLKALGEALTGMGVDATTTKLTAFTAIAPITCPKGYEPALKLTPDGVAWYCKKKR